MSVGLVFFLLAALTALAALIGFGGVGVDLKAAMIVLLFSSLGHLLGGVTFPVRSA